MMQYYSYILMFVVFDVMSIFLYAWGVTFFSIPKEATLPMMGFLGNYVCSHGVCIIFLWKKRNLVIMWNPIDIKLS